MREDAGRDRDERAHDGRHAAEEDGPVAPALEPALRAVELLSAPRCSQRPCRSTAAGRRRGRSPSRSSEPTVYPTSRPARSRRRPRSRESIRSPKRTTSWPANAPGGERAGVEHHELARRGEHGVDHHQHEDGVQAVVADRTWSGSWRSRPASTRAEPSWLAPGAPHEEAPLELGRAEGVRRLDPGDVRSRERAHAAAVAAVPADVRRPAPRRRGESS